METGVHSVEKQDRTVSCSDRHTKALDSKTTDFGRIPVGDPDRPLSYEVHFYLTSVTPADTFI